MKQDLHELKLEFERGLQEGGFAVFRGSARAKEAALPPIFWDSARHADPRAFLEVASALGVKVVVLHVQEFSSEELMEAFEQLSESELPREEAKEMERNLRRFQAYEGFTCALEVSFDYQNETYMFETMTQWYAEFTRMMDDLVEDPFGEDAEEGPGPMGYFSKN